MTTKLTDEQIAELERLLAAATPGRWESRAECLNNWPASDPQPDALVEFILNSADEDAHPAEDGDLFAAARNALPSLLAEVRAHRAGGPAPDATAPPTRRRCGIESHGWDCNGTTDHQPGAKGIRRCPDCGSTYFNRDGAKALDEARADAFGEAARLALEQARRDGGIRQAALETLAEQLLALAGPRSEAGRETRSCLWHADCDAADRALRPGVAPSHPPFREAGRETPPPAALVGALHDRVHKDVGTSRAAKVGRETSGTDAAPERKP